MRAAALTVALALFAAPAAAKPPTAHIVITASESARLGGAYGGWLRVRPRTGPEPKVRGLPYYSMESITQDLLPHSLYLVAGSANHGRVQFPAAIFVDLDRELRALTVDGAGAPPYRLELLGCTDEYYRRLDAVLRAPDAAAQLGPLRDAECVRLGKLLRQSITDANLGDAIALLLDLADRAVTAHLAGTVAELADDPLARLLAGKPSTAVWDQGAVKLEPLAIDGPPEARCARGTAVSGGRLARVELCLDPDGLRFHAEPLAHPAPRAR